MPNRIDLEIHGTWMKCLLILRVSFTISQDGDTLDILVLSRKDTNAARKFFRKLLKGLQYSPNIIVTDKLKSYGAAHREVGLSAVQETKQYQNKRAENSHHRTRQQERQMRRFPIAITCCLHTRSFSGFICAGSTCLPLHIDGRPRFAKHSIDESKKGKDCSHRSGLLLRYNISVPDGICW